MTLTNDPKKVLITGANGLLGQKLVKLLLNYPGYEVFATGLNQSRLPKGSFTWISLDITDGMQVNEVFDQIRPDIVIHTAAMTQADTCELNQGACFKVNVDAVKYIVHACQKHRSFLIYLSTDFIFDGKTGPYHEEDTPNPVNYYGMTKFLAELEVKKYLFDWAIIRTVLVYGIATGMSRSNIILWVKSSLENGKSIKVVTDQWRTPTLVEDLAWGIFLTMEKQAKGIFHISGQEFLSPYEMACQTADFFALDKSLIQGVDGSEFSQPAVRPAVTGFIIDKAKNDLGYEPKSFMDGIGILAKQLKLADY